MPTRRRFLAIVAGLASLGVAPLRARDVLAGPLPEGLTVWRGAAMGARATLALAHPQAGRIIAAARAEIDRLEGIFSLYRADSALVRLNRAGRLDNPPPDLVALLSLCRAVHAATHAAFDPTVQPLWALYARRHSAGRAPTAEEIAQVLDRVDFGAVQIAPDALVLRRSGMALTLNGIAQGYVADRVADLLAGEGLGSALIDMGEIVALGQAPDGEAWPVRIADPAGAKALRRTRLQDAALATSAPLGTVFDAEGRVGHILDPRTGRPGGLWPQISVAAPRAAVADGLSTAFCLMPRPAIDSALAGFAGARLITG